MKGMMRQLKDKNMADLAAIESEVRASCHINISSHIDNTTLIDKKNQLIRIFRLDGVSATTLSPEAVSSLCIERSKLFKDLDQNIGLYFWAVRRKCKALLGGGFEQGSFCEIFNSRYQEKLNQSDLYETVYYIALITKSNSDTNSYKKISYIANNEAFENYISSKKMLLEEASKRLIASFSKYEIRTLSVVKTSNNVISEPLSIIDYVLNHCDFSVPRMPFGADNILMRKKPFFNKKKGTLTLLDINNNIKYAAILSIQSYCSQPFASMLDGLHELSLEFVITQSFAPLYRDEAKKSLKSIQKKMMQSSDESITQAHELSDDMEGLASGEYNKGIHHFTICVYADSEDELDDNITKIKEKADLASLVLTREYIGLEVAYWAQLPGNFSYIARGASISTRNLASFNSFYNQAKGKKTENWWGNALTVMQTGFSTPFYFNIHNRDVGIGLIYGAQGSGKTVLAGSLVLQSMKFGGRRVILDKKQGLKAMVLATKGAYFDLKVNVPSGFNPLQLDDTPLNRDFLINLFAKMLTIYGDKVDEIASKKIKMVVDNVFSYLDKNERVMRNVADFFGAQGKSELRNRFDEWHSNGRYAWVFDNEQDQLTLDKDIIGFDIEEIIKLKDINTPIFMYLLHKAEAALDGMRGGIIIDEGWLVLNDEYLKSRFVEDAAHDTRKKDNFLLILTQEVENVVDNKKIAASLNNSQSFSIFYPNREADFNTYCKELSLTQFEYDLVRNTSINSRNFLLKHKQGNVSEIIKLDFTDMEDMLAVISGSENKAKVLEQVLSEIDKDDVDKWLPVYLERIKSIKTN